jgi:hypothetical protein
VVLGLGARERLGVVVVTVHEQQLEACPAQQALGIAEEAAPFPVARQVAEIAERDERVTTLLDGALDQVAQMPPVTMQVTEDEQTAHQLEPTGARSRCPTQDRRLARGPGRAELRILKVPYGSSVAACSVRDLL